MLKENFEVNQRVKIFDKEDNKYAFGTIIGVKEKFIAIQWDDLSGACFHEEDEYDSIILNE